MNLWCLICDIFQLVPCPDGNVLSQTKFMFGFVLIKLQIKIQNLNDMLHEFYWPNGFFFVKLGCCNVRPVQMWKWAMCGCPAANDCREQERELAGNADDDKTKMGATENKLLFAWWFRFDLSQIWPNVFCNFWSPKFTNESGKGNCFENWNIVV